MLAIAYYLQGKFGKYSYPLARMSDGETNRATEILLVLSIVLVKNTSATTAYAALTVSMMQSVAEPN